MSTDKAALNPCTGFHGDLNGTYPVGDKARANEAAMRLIKTARYVLVVPHFVCIALIITLFDRECLDAAIAICRPGVEYKEIGRTIQPIAEKAGCAVVRRYTGHGIGRVFHGAPTVYHHRSKKVCVWKPAECRKHIDHILTSPNLRRTEL